LNTIDQAHLPKWLQIIDPGIGFAKNLNHNVDLLEPAALQYLKSQLENQYLIVFPLPYLDRRFQS
jgi:dihydropteroate synthase